MAAEPWLVWALIAGMALIAFFARAVFILPGSHLRLPRTAELSEDGTRWDRAGERPGSPLGAHALCRGIDCRDRVFREDGAMAAGAAQILRSGA